MELSTRPVSQYEVYRLTWARNLARQAQTVGQLFERVGSRRSAIEGFQPYRRWWSNRVRVNSLDYAVETCVSRVHAHASFRQAESHPVLEMRNAHPPAVRAADRVWPRSSR
ncbi:MAG: hypothetical protein ACLT98_10840 [Eggerthellaceae bacterium]